ncbi:MAG: ribulose-phosphate 3-epimerase [Butyrivibrio sp.]|uniref:ribulose-phosphate 3-epimerase n=1 Tax=Butyrivibrio sp. LB2008 TaxID=1408305 RepID=UPI00047A575B|nr:ribulose-phosphate 3-epimerase [Butyrivibrio sp.]
MMNILSSSILSADFARLGSQIEEVDKAGTHYIHIDVMDGMFVPSISYGMPIVKSIRGITDKLFDVHLMIVDPIRYIKNFVDVGADSVTFHQEATDDPMAVIDEIHKYGKKAGIAIKPATPIDAIVPYLEKVEMVLVMTVEPGFGGQQLIPESLDKVRELRKLIDKKGIDVDIQVDGGIYIDNVEEILEAGANVIVSGSGIFKGNISENVKTFRKILSE